MEYGQYGMGSRAAFAVQALGDYFDSEDGTRKIPFEVPCRADLM
jgi:hypothetical protein